MEPVLVGSIRLALRRSTKCTVEARKSKGRVMPEALRRANKAKSKIRLRVERVFAEPKARMCLVIPTTGIARATMKIGLANLMRQDQAQ
jgi:hypothetical protein